MVWVRFWLWSVTMKCANSHISNTTPRTNPPFPFPPGKMLNKRSNSQSYLIFVTFSGNTYYDTGKKCY